MALGSRKVAVLLALLLALAAPGFAAGNAATAAGEVQTATSTELETDKNSSVGNVATAKSEAPTANSTEREADKTSPIGDAQTDESKTQTATLTAREADKNSSTGNVATAKSEVQTANSTEVGTDKNSPVGEAGTAEGESQAAERGSAAAERPVARKSLVLLDSSFRAGANWNSGTANSTELETGKNSQVGNAETENNGAQTAKSETQSASSAEARPEERESIPWARSEEFDPTVLLRKDDYWPERLSVHYQFSFGMMASSTGASRGGGLYLGIIRYDLAPNLIFSSAVGFSTTFWSTSDKNHPDGFRNEDTMKPEFRLPYAALDYYPADNMHLRVQVGDGSDCGVGILRRRSCDGFGY